MIKVFKSDEQDFVFYALMGYYFSSLDIAKELERQVYNKPNTTWILQLTDENKVNGFVSVCENKQHYFIDNFYVSPAYRSIGVGSEMIEEIVHTFTDKPLKCIACNPVALHIFKRFEFVEDGHNGKYTKLIKH